jgi:hypothetical protein
VALPARYKAPEVLQPGEEALDPPSAAVAPKRSTVLSFRLPGRVVGRDHLDALTRQIGVESVAVVGHVADQAFGQRLEESLLKRAQDELCFMTLTTRNPDGDRKTMAVDHCHDLGRLAASSSANIKTPLFAPA